MLHIHQIGLLYGHNNAGLHKVTLDINNTPEQHAALRNLLTHYPSLAADTAAHPTHRATRNRVAVWGATDGCNVLTSFAHHFAFS